MTNTIHLQIERADGALLRVLGLIERRGFDISRMTFADEGETRRLSVGITPRDSGRCPEVLSRQIDRLYGVTRVAAAPVPEVSPWTP